MSAVKAPSSGTAPPKGPGLGDRVREYFQTLAYEWRKITWPERKQWIDSTIVVFVFTIFLMIMLASFDLVVGRGMNWLMGLDRTIK